MEEKIVVRARTPSDEVVAARGRVGTVGRNYTLEVDLAGLGTVRTVGPDQFECLLQLRNEVEPLGYRILVNGARRNVWPSGMGRDMGGGRKAFVLVLGVPGRPDLVDIFEPAPESEIARVEDQRAFFERWLAERRGGTRRAHAGGEDG
jgi:hypothetical protein